jgi:hypothetical protein
MNPGPSRLFRNLWILLRPDGRLDSSDPLREGALQKGTAIVQQKKKFNHFFSSV